MQCKSKTGNKIENIAPWETHLEIKFHQRTNKPTLIIKEDGLEKWENYTTGRITQIIHCKISSYSYVVRYNGVASYCGVSGPSA